MNFMVCLLQIIAYLRQRINVNGSWGLYLRAKFERLPLDVRSRSLTILINAPYFANSHETDEKLII